MKKYFTLILGFTYVDGVLLYKNSKIEDELHLFNRNNNIHIDIVKYKNDIDIDISINGPSELINHYSCYIDYFFNKDLLQKTGKTEFIIKTDKEVGNFEKK